VAHKAYGEVYKMSKFKTYYLWWQQSLSDQTLAYAPWKKTHHKFKGRTQKEAQKKMDEVFRFTRITGRFLCVEEGYELTTTGEQTKSHIEQILESACGL
jgi:hypothetical protein